MTFVLYNLEEATTIFGKIWYKRKNTREGERVDI